MTIKVIFTLGTTTYELNIDEPKELEMLNKAITLSNPPSYCDLCKNNDKTRFYLTTNKDKESNIYVNVKCGQCGAKSKLGSYKSGGYFWHHPFEKYVKPGTVEEDTTQ